MADIYFLVLDVDGTLTDGKIYMGAEGEVCKAFDIKDGLGIHDLLPKAGIEPVIITGRSSQIVARRCAEFGISQVFQGVADKASCLHKLLAEQGCNAVNVAYMGDDVNDLACMQLVKDGGGLCACPADAVSEVKTVCDFVCKKNGGNGAVRECIDWILSHK